MASNGVECGMDASKAIQMFRDIQSRMDHSSPFFGRAAMMMYRDVIDHFRTETGPRGAWPAWKDPDYGEKMARGGLPRTKMLQGNGTLRGSILFQGTDGDARVFSTLPYSRIHNFGFPKPMKDKLGRMLNVGKREYMWLSKKCKDAIRTDMLKWLVGGR